MQARSGAQARPASRAVPCSFRRFGLVSAVVTIGALGSAAPVAAEEPGAQDARPEAGPVPFELPPEEARRGAETRGAAAPRARDEPALADLGTFIELRDDFVSRGDRGFSNSAVIRGDYAFNRSVSLRADVPLAVTQGARGERSVGLGDVLIRPLVRVVGLRRFAMLLGTDLVLDSATSRDLGSGKNLVGPLLQAYVGSPKGSRVGLFLQHVVSFGGDPERDDVHASVVRPFAVIGLPRGFWLQPDQRFQINYRGGPRLVSTSVLEVGAGLSERVLVYVDPGIQVDSRGTVDWLVTGGVRWEFPTPERARERAATPARRAERAATSARPSEHAASD